MRVFPEASTVFDAVKRMRELYPTEDEPMAFDLEWCLVHFYLTLSTM